jgi:hypothetical protein
MTDLFEYAETLPSPPASVAFDGDTYQPEHDHTRLKGQLWRVFQLMSDGKWRSLAEISEDAGGSEASVSARLRDLRKEQYGGREIQRERISGGLWHYRMVKNVSR